MEVRTVSELSERINRLEARVAENRRVIASQQEAIGFQQAMLRIDVAEAEAVTAFKFAVTKAIKAGLDP